MCSSLEASKEFLLDVALGDKVGIWFERFAFPQLSGSLVAFLFPTARTLHGNFWLLFPPCPQWHKCP